MLELCLDDDRDRRGMSRRLTMTPDGFAEQLRGVLDLEVPDAEAERRDREMVDAPVRRALQCAAQRLLHFRARDRLIVARHHAVNEQLDTQSASRSHNGRPDREGLIDSEMSREPVTTRDFQATHQWRRRAECSIDRSSDGIGFDEGEIVGAYLDHSGRAQEMASDVSLLIQLRYFSRPA
jgi:hypothetical protein